MRIGLLVALVLAGCSTYQFESPTAVLGVKTTARTCLSKGTAPVDLYIRNTGEKALRIYVRPDPKRPPHVLSWMSYDILNELGASANGPGGHGPLPQNELAIAPGESVEVIANIYDLASSDYQLQRRVEVTDREGRRYSTPLFKPCG